jgi:hypothetical protein
MFLTIQLDDDSPLVEVLDLTQLFDPFEVRVLGRLHAGEELLDHQPWPKDELRFPSGEASPPAGCIRRGGSRLRIRRSAGRC